VVLCYRELANPYKNYYRKIPVMKIKNFRLLMEAKPNNNRVAIFEDRHCEDHIPSLEGRPNPLPETVERVQVISEALRKADFSSQLRFISPEPATDEELELIHKVTHLARIRTTVEKAAVHDSFMYVDKDPDVAVTKGSNIAARYAAGSVRDAVRTVLSPGVEKRAFCNVRPPGHHACSNKAAGFCLYNNVWFGAQVARQFMIDTLGVKEPRVAIVDWDVHHGDGGQAFVLQQENLKLHTYFVSIHQKFNTQWPGTGKECRKVRQNATVICHNIPVGGGDDHVRDYFDAELINDLTQWKPDLILISCGFDGHELDPVGQLKYSSHLYGWMTRKLVGVANQCCHGRIVSVLEGGYSMQALRESSVEHVKALLEL
jgi:acetoin utilization deacetylase AcuC-like enzyme